MPVIGIPWAIAAAIGALAGGGATVGEDIYSNLNKPNTAAQEQQAQQAQANQAALTKQEAVLGQQGNAQAQTGGSLTAPGTENFVSQLAGYPGYSSSTPSPSGGSPGASSPSGTAPGAGTPQIAALLQQLQGSGGSAGQNISGGGGQPSGQQAPETGFFELSRNPLGGG
jgi:hypothetical protein